MQEHERRRPCIIISPVASGHLFESTERERCEKNAHAVELQTKLESKAIWGHKKSHLVLVINILISI